MNRREQVVVMILMTFLMAVAGWMLVSHLGVTTGDREFRAAFSNVSPGMTEAAVIERLGKPDEITERFRLGQYKGNEREYAAAAQSGATRYLLWRRGGHFIYAVGIDRAGAVRYVGSGGT